MKLILTGGLGHIGSGLLEKINMFKNIKGVTIIDNVSSNKISALFFLKSKIPIKFIDQNLSNLNLKNIIKKKDIIVHLAAMTDAAGSFKNRNKIFENNFISTKKIVDFSSKNRNKCIFFTSTSVYGSSSKIMFEDDENNLNPQSPYAACKIKEEKYIKRKSKNNSFKYTILRLGTIFGPSKGMRFHTAVNKFCYQASLRKPITVWKTAFNQKRPYLDLLDAIMCIKFVIDNDLFDNQIYNVVTNNISVKKLLNIINKHTKVKVKYVNNKIMNQLSYEANCEKIKDKGFKFAGNMNQQIKNTINLFKGLN